MSVQKFLVRTLTTMSYNLALKWLNSYNSMPDIRAFMTRNETGETYTVKVYEYRKSEWEC